MVRRSPRPFSDGSCRLINDSDLIASNFIECINDCFIYQNVQKVVLSDSNNRIDCLKHLPPLGGIEHGHHVLNFKYNFKDDRIDSQTKGKHKILFKKGKYKELSVYFSSFNWENEFQDLNANDCYKKWLSIYHVGCEKLIPSMFLHKGKRSAPWMSRVLRKMVKLKKRLWYKCRNSGFKQVEMVEDYKILNKNVKKRVTEDIKAFELSLAKNSKKNPKSVFAYLNSKTVIKDSIKALKNENGSITTSGVDIANCLNDYFVSVFFKDESLDESVIFPEKCENVCIDPKFGVIDVSEQLENLNVNKATGVDLVHPYVLKECAKSLSIPLSIIFKKSYFSGVVPDEWLNANITPLFKKGNKLEPTNYRPVSLTSTVCKVMEKMIREVMMNHLVSNNLLASEQHGFVNGKNCSSNLLEAFDFITKAYEDGINIDFIFLDFAKAFDSVSLFKLCCKLYGYGFRSFMLEWCKAFLSNRKQRVVMGEYISEWKQVTSGVPQGSVLGPLMFVIFINDLMVDVINVLKLFADDTKIMSKIFDYNSCIALQDDLNKLLNWSNEWSIKFNEDKCKVMHIGKTNPHFDYKMNDQTLQKTEVERDRCNNIK